MTALVVVVVPPGPLDAVTETLVDWSAAGLLSPMVVLDPSGVRGQDFPVSYVADGQRWGGNIQQVLTSQRYDRVRLCVLVPAIGEAPGLSAAAEHGVHQAILGTGAVPKVELIRAIVTRPGSGQGRVDLVREGWHNVLLSPEDSPGPGAGHSPLPPSVDPHEIAPYAAAALAGLTGLWQGIDEGPLDDAPAPYGQNVRLMRGYYRDLDASGIQATVRNEITELRDEVPLPNQHGRPAVYIDDTQMATNDMAAAVLRKHASTFRGQRVQPAAVEADNVGMWKAITMLLGFIWASITLAPMKWYSMVVGNVSSAAARGVHSVVFGSDPSAYNVVAKGELAGGNADWQQLARASATLGDALDSDGTPRQHEVTGDFSAVWRDYIECGLTLVDAGDRSHNIAPIQVGNERGVLRRMTDLVPASGFDKIPPRVASAVGITKVRAADPLGTHTLRQRLHHVSGQPNLARDVDSTLQELDAWEARGQQSYASRMGGMIAQQLMRTADEVRGLMQRVQQAAQAEQVDSGSAARQKSIALWMRVLFIVFLAVVALMLVGGWQQWWEWSTSGITIGISFLVWLIGSFVLFVMGQRELFRDINRRKVAVSQSEADQRNLRTAMRDLRRQTEAYGQFLEWTRALGVLAHRPFGPPVPPPESVDQLSAGLPRNVALGAAQAEPAAIAKVVSLLRRETFGAGWLSRPWESMLADAGRRLGPDAYEISEDPRRMWLQRAGVQESFLTRWADVLEAEGVSRTGGDELWDYVMRRLTDPNSHQLREELIGQVRTADGDTVPAAKFWRGIGDEQPPASGDLDARVLNRDARMSGRATVRQRWPQVRAEGLSRRAVLVELGDAFPSYEIDLTHSEEPEQTAAASWADSSWQAEPASAPAQTIWEQSGTPAADSQAGTGTPGAEQTDDGPPAGTAMPDGLVF